MTTWRMGVLSMLVAGAALAQVQVNSGGKSVTVTPGGVQAQKGAKAVEVQTGAAGTTVTSPGSQGAAVDAAAGTADGKWAVDGQGRTETHACAANEDVSVAGMGHVITLTGTCRAIYLSGKDNQVKADVAGSIHVSGMDNVASWKTGAGGKKPKIHLSGKGNSAPQVK